LEVSAPPRPARLAYLNARYPALSHTFIQREVEDLRERGVEVVTFSVRKPSLSELGEGADPGEVARTTYLLRGGHLARGVLRALVASPLRLLRVLWASQRLSPGGWRARARHAAYAAEAVRLAHEMRRRALSHVHVHMANNAAMVALLATRFDPSLRYSMTIHGSAEFFDVFRLRLREKAESAVFVRCISDFCRAQVMAWTDPAAWDRFHVVHCGIPSDAFAGGESRRDTTMRVLRVGRLVPIKAYPVLFEALRSLDARGVPWALRMAGDGPERARLEALAERLGISDRVEFLGAVSAPRIPDEMRRASVLVVSSCMEGVPVVLMEAMAAGLPVLGTRVGGVAELVEDGATGRVVSPGSAEALASALAEMWEDPRGTAARAEAARERVRSEFDLRGTGPRMRALFERYGVIPPAGPGGLDGSVRA
jgi:glycosyltransferase involved in cell wall biosynthesis